MPVTNTLCDSLCLQQQLQQQSTSFNVNGSSQHTSSTFSRLTEKAITSAQKPVAGQEYQGPLFILVQEMVLCTLAVPLRNVHFHSLQYSIVSRSGMEPTWYATPC